jgi:putative ABC transport system substrate-binding protein
MEQAIGTFAREPNGGLIVLPDATTTNLRESLVALASRYRLPAIYPFRYFAESGGLISYGIDTADEFRLAAGYVSRILKGEKPADLPVQAPTKFELVINLKTAQALGLDLPPFLPFAPGWARPGTRPTADRDRAGRLFGSEARRRAPGASLGFPR